MGHSETQLDVPVTGKWEQGEIALLHKSRFDLTIAEVAEKLGRSFKSTEAKITELGIRYQKTGEQHHNAAYTNAQVQNAIALYLTHRSQSEIAKLLDIPLGTISTWVGGYSRSFDIDWDTIEREIDEYNKRTTDKTN